jgi:hypothetical protein
MARHNKVIRIGVVAYDDGDLIVWVERTGIRLPLPYVTWGGREVAPYQWGSGKERISQSSVERALLQEIHMPDVQ